MLYLYPFAIGCDILWNWFLQGLLGAIKTPYGYNKTDPGNETFPTSSDRSGKLDTQVGPCFLKILFCSPSFPSQTSSQDI